VTKIWRARHGTIKLDTASNVSIDSSQTLESFFGATALTVSNAKNITITPPEITVDKVDLIGVDANNFQNAELEKKPVGVGKVTGTLVLDADEVLEAKLFSSSTAISSPVAATRYQIGDGSEQDVAILVILKDGPDAVAFAMDNAVLKLGDAKSAGDGHVEQDFEATCLPRDFYMEYYD